MENWKQWKERAKAGSMKQYGNYWEEGTVADGRMRWRTPSKNPDTKDVLVLRLKKKVILKFKF